MELKSTTQCAQGISDACGNYALVSRAVVVEVATTLAGKVGDDAVCRAWRERANLH
jgi:hypothetical protein